MPFPPKTRSETQAERDRLLEMHEVEDEDTPIHSPAMAKISERTKSITTSTTSIDRRVGNLEKGQSDARVELAAVGLKVVALDSKVDVLVEESQHTRREREEREKRAETRADAELQFRRDRLNKILVPLVAVLTTLAAALAAALAGVFK